MAEQKMKSRAELNADYHNQLREMRINCEHRDSKGPTLVLGSTIRDDYAKRYGDDVMVCKKCHAVIPIESVSEQEFKSALDTINTMCDQLKILGNPSDDDMNQIKSIQHMVDDQRNIFGPFYFGEMKKFTKGNGRNNKNQERQKGRLGLTSSQFNTR